MGREKRATWKSNKWLMGDYFPTLLFYIYIYIYIFLSVQRVVKINYLNVMGEFWWGEEERDNKKSRFEIVVVSIENSH